MNTTTATETKVYIAAVGLASDEIGRMVYVGDEVDLSDVAKIRWYDNLIKVQASSVMEALDKIYEAANIGEHGWAAEYRAARSRSLSGGDFIQILESGVSGFVTYQVTSFGFKPVDLSGSTIKREYYG